MADGNALLASLLMGQKRRSDPLEQQQKYGASLMQQGSATTPVLSPWEGVARALQGGLGGLMSGYAYQQQEEQDKGNIAALSDAATKTTPQDIANALKGIKGNSEMMVPVLGQIIQGRLDKTLKDDAARGSLDAGLGGFGIRPGAGQPQSVFTAPVPNGAAPAQSEGWDNNSGNIRASNVNWEGKGAPITAGANGQFETFATPQAGANAHFKNFAAYAQANPNITVAQALAQWSPSNENNTQAVIRSISEETGINPGMPLGDVLRDPLVAARLLDAQTRLEKGGLPKGFTADTFVAAAGGQPQIAQASTSSAAPQPLQPTQAPSATAPQQPQQSQLAPAAAQYLQQAQSLRASDPVRALELVKKAEEAQAAYQTMLQTRQYDASENDRRDTTKRKLDQPQEIFTNEDKMRDNFTREPAVKSYRAVIPLMESAKGAETRPSRAADLNLINAMAKIMDPDSIVHQSESGAVVATASVTERLQGYIGQLNGQAMLNPDMRRKLMVEIESRFNPLKESHDELLKQYTATAESYGLDPKRTFFNVRPGGGGDRQVIGNAPTQAELQVWAEGKKPGGTVRIDINGKPL